MPMSYHHHHKSSVIVCSSLLWFSEYRPIIMNIPHAVNLRSEAMSSSAGIHFDQRAKCVQSPQRVHCHFVLVCVQQASKASKQQKHQTPKTKTPPTTTNIYITQTTKHDDFLQWKFSLPPRAHLHVDHTALIHALPPYTVRGGLPVHCSPLSQTEDKTATIIDQKVIVIIIKK